MSWKRGLASLALAILLVIVGCHPIEPETPCDEDSPDWPECHDQGTGTGGQ